jgi:hypothetical protein
MRQFIALGRPVSPVAWVMNGATIKEFLQAYPNPGETIKTLEAKLIKPRKKFMLFKRA